MSFGRSQMRSARRFILAFSALVTGSLAFASGAGAVSEDVKKACKSDYFRHCASHEVGSPELRQCMRTVGENLSTPCLVALVKAGEITKEDVERHNAAKASGQTLGKVAQTPKPKAPKTKSKVAQQEKAPKANAKVTQAQKAKPNAKVVQASAAGKVPAAKFSAGAKSKTKVQTASNERKAAVAQAKPPKNAASASKVAKVAEKPDFTQPPPRKTKTATYDAPIASEPEVAYTHNLCRAKRLNGTVAEFTCGLDQRCCYLPLSDQEYCRPLGKPCF